MSDSFRKGFAQATAVGLLGGVAAALIWYLVAAMVGNEMRFFGIGVGYLIGRMVCLGAGQKRGIPLQFLSVAITSATLLVVNYLAFLHLLRKYLLEQKVEGYTGGISFMHPMNPAYIGNLLSPLGLLFWAAAICVAFLIPRSKI